LSGEVHHLSPSLAAPEQFHRLDMQAWEKRGRGDYRGWLDGRFDKAFVPLKRR
jgi:hypothetical protein